MARRKRQFLEDDDSDSSVGDDNDLDDPSYDVHDPDARAERELFENPYKRKRRRKDPKEDAIYGVFASSDEEGERGESSSRKGGKKSDWAKAPAFTAGAKVDLDKAMDVDEAMKEASASSDSGSDADADGDDDDEEYSDAEDVRDDSMPRPSKEPSPQVREEEEEEEERPRFGGLGLGATKAGIGIGARKTGLGGIGASSRGNPASAFSGFSKSGSNTFNLSSVTETPPTTSPAPEADRATPETLNVPTAFGKQARPQRAFVREDASSGSSTPKPANISATERAHFNKISGTFGARLLEKMGWQAGTGLGTTGEGIVTPVESKLRPKGMGLAFKGFKEKTEQAKAEARRRGEVVSDEEEETRRRKGKKPKGQLQEKSDVWKKPKKTKKKIEHKTYEQIVAEAGQDVASGIGQIIDATGATPREVSSLADVSMASWTPTTDPMRLPEVRHNLRLITEACKGDLDGLAKEARTLEERKKWIQQEDERLLKRVEDEAQLIARLQQVHLVVDDINSQAKQLKSSYDVSLEPFSASFETLIGLYPGEFERYHLDEVVVAAIAPVVRRMFAQWQPLEDPTAFTSNFRLWRKALKMTESDETPATQVQVYGSSTLMTPYESLIWNAWLPKVRSCINNDWSPDDPQPVVRLYEAWSRYLPPFVRDNFFDQLVLPKVHKAVSDWSLRRHKVSLRALVFPWLPHIGLRLEDVLSDARRKIKSTLRGWAVVEGMPEDLAAWREVFDVGDWDSMLLKYVVPKLGARLRDDFKVNPRQQQMAPLQDVLRWEDLLRPSILSQILETEFFPKWLDVLHLWLVSPNPSFEEVAQWYTFWKGTFTENVQNMPGIAQGFTRGLQLMNKAIELGPRATTDLPRPGHRPAPPSPKPLATSRQSTPKPRPARTQEITFKSIVEDYASSHNLLFIPTGRAHENSRMPLFRVSQTADGKGGLLVYIMDDAVWAPDGELYRAISLEDMVLRATKL
ncbi:hypothetical protein PHLGIDRAFT_75791 [Phlebiopsis gigantea 11061_1 CR5-6]|uniref:G-patch domain-containing protein n=1 Tax=Phlebiopsis gigantea (strain 11061_1 CR5-6) TaxID=745531 RepID=A0A0C3S3P1_PHLG1|nr:hypothetical protein PHLGIDRAFT_75791 [Phlebiopsis gigantea 11061_1 CR5-6]